MTADDAMRCLTHLNAYHGGVRTHQEQNQHVASAEGITTRDADLATAICALQQLACTAHVVTCSGVCTQPECHLPLGAH